MTNFIFAQERSNVDKILWEQNQKLEWIDFSGMPPNPIPNLAEAVTSVHIELKGEVYEDEIPDLLVQTYFLKNSSWTITDSKETLSHEQLHFDIAELTARKIRKRIEELKESKESNSEVYFQEYERIQTEGNDLQKKYDSESYFNNEKQEEWINKIRIDLMRFAEFQIDK